MFEQTFKNIDDILHKDAGCGSELDYVEQTSWVLFLKYLDDLEKDKATSAELRGKAYTKYYRQAVSMEKLPILLTNKYQSLEDAKEILGEVASISRLFIEFQQYLYQQKIA